MQEKAARIPKRRKSTPANSDVYWKGPQQGELWNPKEYSSLLLDQTKQNLPIPPKEDSNTP